MNNEDNRTVKASFRGCPISDRKLFPHSTCIMPISIGQRIHEGEKLSAAIKLINSNFKACCLLVDDSIQRYTMKITHDTDINYLHQIALKEGSAWLERNLNTLNLLTIPHDIKR